MSAYTILYQKMLRDVAEKTEFLIIKHGFVFGGETFNLDQASQTKWLALATMQNSLSWPIDISPRTGVYSLTQANLVPFQNAGLQVVQGYKDSGRALRLQLEASTSLSDLAQIVDDRT
jgi:hypothetical protein